MRLIECHIENFGGLHDKTIKFQQGFHVICEENGWGKSALAAFIRVMFYGFEGERKRELKENERKFYTPWQGGAYGGSLTFEVGGKRYTASRIFGGKESQDTFELRDADTNLLTRDYSADLGSELFGIDRASFLRTVFIGQNQAETSATDDIHAKVSGITDETFDMNNYQKAQDKLAVISNRLTPKRSTGSIFKKKELAASLKRSVADGAGTESSLEEYREMLAGQRGEYEQCLIRREEILRGQEEAVRIQSALAKKDEWDRLRQETRNWEERRREVRARFPREVPGIREMDDCLEKCGQLEKAEAREGVSALSHSEELRLLEYETLFRDGVPEPEEIEKRIADAGRLVQLEQRLAGEQLSLSERERLQNLESLFGEEREAVSSISALWNNRNSRKAALPSNRASLALLGRTMHQERKKGGVEILLWLLGAALLIAGGIMLAVYGRAELLLEILLAVAGALAAAVGFFIKINRKKREDTGDASGEYQELQRQVQEDEEYIRKAEEKVSSYLAACGRIFDEESVSQTLQELSGEYVEYLSLAKKSQKAENSDLFEEIAVLKNRIETFLKPFVKASGESAYSQNLYALKSWAAAYSLLKEKRESAFESRRATGAIREELGQFLQKYGLESETGGESGMRKHFSEIRDSMNELQNAGSMVERARQQLEEFEARTDMSVLEREIPQDVPSLEEWNQKNLEITEKMDKIQETIRNYLSVLDLKQEELEHLEEEKNRLEETEEELKREIRMFSDVQKTREYLERARDAITNRYTSTLMDAFRTSYQAIAKNSADAFHMDANTKLTVDGGGVQRELDSLSAGYRDLVGLCLRIALVGAMYEQEPPMLIMDDPFVNMDDEKVQESLRYLDEISSKYQVIYFTCSDVRAGGKKNG